ncbi:hypothetical protein [Caballeronia novacaledonica]|uniref:Uncharacterized protein n=1 Tax=Caballeronia novacaledonica TaxID=1544861 RepID=A0AA37II96_9BURK|nr:hypothetical protein [Caballeronia novacaledonica]GJH30235.1 hypothetical protein CBA19CS42_36985 [Caballeronia novacaledonica]
MDESVFQGETGKQGTKAQNPMDKLMKAAIVAVVCSLLLAGAGVFYYFVIFLPGIERQKLELSQQAERDAAKRAEQAMIDAKNKEEQAKNDAFLKETQKKLMYDACKADARSNYTADWANACKDIASMTSQGLRNCLADKNLGGNAYLGESYCRRLYPQGDASANCSLPVSRADRINKTFHDAQEKCLQEAQLGM